MRLRKLNWSKEELEDLYVKQDLSMVEIAKLYDCHRDAVLYWLKKFNIPRKYNWKQKRIDAQRDWLYQKYIIEGLSTHKIAELLNSNHQTVLYRMKRCGIPTKSRIEAITGENSANWKGGIIHLSTGYVMVKDSQQPRGYIFEHRKLMENHLGRKLTPDEIIHHINGNKADNRIENLIITTKSKHTTYHLKERWKKHEYQ